MEWARKVVHRGLQKPRGHVQVYINITSMGAREVRSGWRLTAGQNVSLTNGVFDGNCSNENSRVLRRRAATFVIVIFATSAKR